MRELIEENNNIKESLNLKNENDSPSDDDVETTTNTKTNKTRVNYKIYKDLTEFKDYLSQLIESKIFYNYNCYEMIESMIEVINNKETNASFFKKLATLVKNKLNAVTTLKFSTTEIDPERNDHFEADRKILLELQNKMIYLNSECLNKNKYTEKTNLKKPITGLDRFYKINDIYVVKPEFIHKHISEYKDIIDKISEDVIRKINAYTYIASLTIIFQLHILEEYEISEENAGIKAIKDKIITLFADEKVVIRKQSAPSITKKKTTNNVVTVDNKKNDTSYLNFNSFDNTGVIEEIEENLNNIEEKE